MRLIMRIGLLVCVFTGWGLPVGATLVDEVLASYQPIKTLSCEVRKETDSGDTQMRMLSRVFFESPNRLHVENVKPSERRILSDGTNLYYHVKGAAKGFSRPLNELTPDWLVRVEAIPGTPAEYLLRLRGLPETELEGSDEYPVRRAYQGERGFWVLSLDPEKRPARIEMFRDDTREQRVILAEFSGFQDVGDGVWIPTRHREETVAPTGSSKEVSRIGNLAVNQPILPELFRAAPYFKGVQFVYDFQDLFKP